MIINLEEALEEELAYPEEGLIPVETIELNHPSFAEPYRFVNYPRDVELRLEGTAPYDAGLLKTFSKASFDAQVSPATEETPYLDLEIGNINKELTPIIDEALVIAAPIEIIFRMYHLDDVDVVQAKSPLMYLFSATQSETAVKGRAKFKDLSNLSVPKFKRDLNNIPSLMAFF